MLEICIGTKKAALGQPSGNSNIVFRDIGIISRGAVAGDRVKGALGIGINLVADAANASVAGLGVFVFFHVYEDFVCVNHWLVT